MSELQHTPGPWFIVDASNGDWPDGCELCIDDVEGGNPETDFCIASAVHGNPYILEANARLIAAAPELLEALESFVSHGSCYDETDMQKARSAIAKAKGE